MGKLIVGILMAIWALALWIALFYAWRRAYKEWKSNCANRLSTYTATVLDRRATKSAPDKMEYAILFEFEKRQKEFAVDEHVYNTARVGCEGLLHLRGGQFEAFELKPDAERAEDLYRRIAKS
ncbi:MAG: DUF2500 family protein [Armatimonadetes bacterium]|nr:DUF2500 family protein [Armatimonadota bacterium]